MKTVASFFLSLIAVAGLAVSGQADEKKSEHVVQISVPEMTCTGCSTSVTDALTEVKGVSKAEVILKQKVALISSKEKIDDKTLKKAIEAEGYKVKKIERVALSYKDAKEALEKKSS